MSDAAANAAAAPRRSVLVTIDDLPLASLGSYRSAEQRRATVERLCRILERRRVPAVGFVNMSLHARDPSLLGRWKRCVRLGNHTWSHPSIDKVGLEAYLADLRRGHHALRGVVGAGATIPFRFPFLKRGFAPRIRRAIERELARLHSPIVPVTIDTWDWLYAAGHRRAMRDADPAAARRYRIGWAWNLQEATLEAEWLARGLFGREPPQILLLHANALNAERLDRFLDWLERRGYRYVDLDAALADAAYAEVDRSWLPNGDSWWRRLRRSRSLADRAAAPPVDFPELEPAPARPAPASRAAPKAAR